MQVMFFSFYTQSVYSAANCRGRPEAGSGLCSLGISTCDAFRDRADYATYNHVNVPTLHYIYHLRTTL